jgi:transcriptional regulator with XRE-family HTH domain
VATSRLSLHIDYPALVRSLRAARGLTQEQLAREVGVTFSTVNCWEPGKHRPIPSLASRLIALAQEAGVAPVPVARRRRLLGGGAGLSATGS